MSKLQAILLDRDALREALRGIPQTDVETMVTNLKAASDERSKAIESIRQQIKDAGYTPERFFELLEEGTQPNTRSETEKASTKKSPAKKPPAKATPRTSVKYRLRDGDNVIEWGGRGRPPKALAKAKADGRLEEYRV